MRYVIAGIVVLLFLAACQGGGVTTTDVDVSAPGANVKVDADAGGADVQVDAGGAKVDVSAGSSKTLADVLGAAKLIKYKVAYDVTANGVKTTMTQVVKLPKFAALTTTQGIESKTIFDGSDIIACTKQAEWSCMKIAAGEQSIGTMDTEKSFETADTSMKPRGTCTRAGETGIAFDVTTQGATVRVCYTLDGIPLEMSTTAQGATTSMVATSVSRTVSDSEFVPPAEPQDLSALMAQYGAQ